MALRDLVRNHLYGKPDRRDFTSEDLPGNRVALFGHVLNIRLGKMIGMNLLYLLFWLPAAGWSLLNGLQVINLATTLTAKELEVANIYFVGDGAGKAGNIVTAAATGLVAARDIIERM